MRRLAACLGVALAAALPATAEESGSQPPAPAAPAAAPSAPPAESGAATGETKVAWHRLRMRLSGSLCTACLYELEHSMAAVPGVFAFKAKPSRGNYINGLSPEITSWAEGLAIYDPAKLSLVELRYVIKTKGYHSWHLADQSLGHAPTDKDETLR